MKVILSWVVLVTALAVLPSTKARLHAADEDVAGPWTGRDWGNVRVKSAPMKGVYSGTYTDTYNGELGSFQFEQVGEREYKGEWWESNKRRRGSFELDVSKDGNRIDITWDALDGDRSKPKNGNSVWQRAEFKTLDSLRMENERLKNEIVRIMDAARQQLQKQREAVNGEKLKTVREREMMDALILSALKSSDNSIQKWGEQAADQIDRWRQLLESTDALVAKLGNEELMDEELVWRINDSRSLFTLFRDVVDRDAPDWQTIVSVLAVRLPRRDGNAEELEKSLEGMIGSIRHAAAEERRRNAARSSDPFGGGSGSDPFGGRKRK